MGWVERHVVAQQARSHAPRGEFSSAFWDERGWGTQPTSREKFLALTIEELAKTGPHSFNATLICDLLGTTYPMVNHYFGNRDGLVAEAVATAYRHYIQSLRIAAELGESPRARLESWMWRQIEWTAEHPGIAVVLDFPESSLQVTTLLREKFQTDMTELFEYNMAVLMHLVADVQGGTATPITLELGNLPREHIMADHALVNRASTIGLATMGAAVWMAGSHAPASSSEETAEWRQAMLRSHVASLVELAATPL